MALMPKTQREQAMVLVAIIGLAGAGAYWNWVYSPRTDALGLTEKHIEQLDKRNRLAKADMAKGTVAELRQQAQDYAQNLDLMRQLVPAANEVTTLLDQVSTAARRVGLDISKLEPLGTEQGGDFDAYKYRFTMLGNYHAVSEFLANVGSLTRIIVPQNIIMASTSGTPLAASKRSVQVSFELHTYVAKTAPPPKPAEAAKGGGE